MKYTCRECDKYLDCKFNGRKGSSQICKDFTNNLKMIRELKKIKAEIEKKQEEVIGINQKANFQNENDYGLYFGYESSIGIIDNHISELKGGAK